MAISLDTASATAVESPTEAPIRRSAHSHVNLSSASTLQPLEPIRPRTKKKYRHIAAVHSKPRTSCLSHDSEIAPSFLGFRNLMVIVLIVGNLRLMIENFKKYGVLICIRCHDYRRQDIRLGAALLFIIPCHLFVAYIVELAAAQQARASIKGSGKKRSGTATPGGSYVPSDEELKKFQST